MKYSISEMMQNTEDTYTDQLQEEDYKLSALEVKRIHKQVMKKRQNKQSARIKQFKKIIVMLAATMGCCATLYAVNQMKAADFLLKENANNLAESGQVLEISNEHQGIKVTVKGTIGYAKAMALIYEVEKTDDIAFEGNELIFSSYIEIENGDSPIRYKFNDNREVKSERTPTKRVYIGTISNYFDNVEYLVDDAGEIETVKHDNVDNFVGKKMKFVIEEVAERYRSLDKPDIDLRDYLSMNPCGPIEPIRDDKLALKYWGDKDEIGKYNPPTHMLTESKLNLVPYKALPKVTIDNIGFIEGKLHIRTHNMMAMWEKKYRPKTNSPVVTMDRGMLVADSGIRVRMVRKKNPGQYMCSTSENYALEIYDKNGKCIEPQYTNYNMFPGEGHKPDKYEVYDIKDREALSQCSFEAWIDVNKKITKDQWILPFEMEKTQGSMDIDYTGTIKNPELQERWQVDRLELANVWISIQLTCQNPTYEDPPMPTPIKLIMKDSSQLTLMPAFGEKNDSNKGSATDVKDCYLYKNQQNNVVNIDGFLIKAIDPSQVDAIQIGEIKIPVNVASK
ncbi:MAG: hypothetical protein AB9856_21700 [Cellulosilyticaceae bacterium]